MLVHGARPRFMSHSSEVRSLRALDYLTELGDDALAELRHTPSLAVLLPVPFPFVQDFFERYDGSPRVFKARMKRRQSQPQGVRSAKISHNTVRERLANGKCILVIKRDMATAACRIAWGNQLKSMFVTTGLYPLQQKRAERL